MMLRVSHKSEASSTSLAAADESTGVRRNARSQAPSADAAVGVTGYYKGWSIRATGQYAGAVAAAAATISFLMLLDPFTNPKHFLLVMLGCVVSGTFFGYASAFGRMQDALRSKDEFREEMHRLVERNQEFQKIVLERRLSSAVPQLTESSPPVSAVLQPTESSRPATAPLLKEAAPTKRSGGKK